MNKRVDQILVDLNIFESRTKAQASIEEGLVRFRGKLIDKPSSTIHASAKKEDFEVTAGRANRYVSRGGLKLEGALRKINLDVKNFSALDVGISTGGFTDCLLQAGIKSVVGVDVGDKQIHFKIASDKRVEYFENTHIKDFRTDKKFDLIVADVSFISLKAVLPLVVPFIAPSGLLLALIKPQFELDAKKLGKNGIVKDSSQFKIIENSFKSTVQELGLNVLDYFDSPILGKDGNKEFFIYASKNRTHSDA